MKKMYETRHIKIVPNEESGLLGPKKISFLGMLFFSMSASIATLVLNSRSKAIRILTEKKVDPVLKTASRTIPPSKVRRFADKRLHLKVDKRNSNWQRKPGKSTAHNDINCNLLIHIILVNIGSLRNRHLPATNFVRNKDIVHV